MLPRLPWLVRALVLLTLWGQQSVQARRGQQRVQPRRGARCAEGKAACADLHTLNRLLMNMAAHGINDSVHDERILLEVKNFRKIKQKTKLHGCVLLKVLDFFEDVLLKTAQHPHLKAFLPAMQRCVKVKEKSCDGLYHKANWNAGNQSQPLSSLKPRDMAILQLHLLQSASEKLSDPGLVDKALMEMQGLVKGGYVQGRGWRRWEKTKQG
ncbi:uncharacterized protein si:ch211-266a5.12 [Hypomesus transpacificus]|uniref:uncharacterized protein si:ch211-266a5.12 n=1 Tax=Hypomesus transpacificus TaxID=137520 RepID=UPI001F07332E|nr:uncharacterized protein si:ch211-266a5.12 [Hypomesus transpacificus]XP_046870622.1 uncharacterized protein si:ch211-266a5.12 [Hypomesus transpacificus]